MALDPKYNYITTTNSKEDIELLLGFFNTLLKKARPIRSELDEQMAEEIRDCIRDTFEELPKNKQFQKVNKKK